MNIPSLLSIALLTASAIVPSAALADCAPTRFSDPNDPHNLGQFSPVEGVENGYVNLNSGQINADGNIQFATDNVVNEKDGVCTMYLMWEVNCERQKFRLLWSRAFYDQDWPTDRDMTIQGDKVWTNYNTPMGTKRIGNVANLFCARKNQLPTMPP